MRASLCLLAVAVTALFSPPAQAAPVADALRTELKLLAEDVAKIIEKKGGGGIAIGEFNGSVEVVGHAGPGIQLALAEELRAAKLTIDNQNHRFEITGRYQPFHDTRENRKKFFNDATSLKPEDATSLNAVRLVAFLFDKDTGEPLAERPTGRLIFGAEAVPAMLGLNTSNPPLRYPTDISDIIEKARKEPQVDLRGTQIAGQTGHYALELLVKESGKYVAKPVTLEKGQPFVALQNADIYGVRLINNSPHEVAVDLRIDGVNSFAFSNEKSRYWIIAPQSHTDIIGWHRNETTTTEFKVTANFPDTAAAKLQLKPSASIGLITAHFSASWEKDTERPEDEPEVQGRGTGFGSDVKIKTKQVTRTIGQIRDNLAVRYEK